MSEAQGQPLMCGELGRLRSLATRFLAEAAYRDEQDMCEAFLGLVNEKIGEQQKRDWLDAELKKGLG